MAGTCKCHKCGTVMPLYTMTCYNCMQLPKIYEHDVWHNCWVHITEMQATSVRAEGYYKIKEARANFDDLDFIVTFGPKGTPKDGNVIYTGYSHFTIVNVDIATVYYTIDAAYTIYKTPPPTKEEIVKSGVKVKIKSLEQLIEISAFNPESEDNEIDNSDLEWSYGTFGRLTEQIKAMIFNLKPDPWGSYNPHSPWGTTRKENYVPKIILTPDHTTGSYDLKFVSSGNAQWKICEAYISMLKGSIPASDRMYNPTTKLWSVLEKYIDALKKLADTIGMEIEEQYPVSADGFFYEHAINAPVLETKDTLTLKLITLLGITEETLKDTMATKKAYRAKAIEWHPDRNNGDGTKMSELNSIWSAYNAS